MTMKKTLIASAVMVPAFSLRQPRLLLKSTRQASLSP